MINIPLEHTSDLDKILNWHLNAYMPDRFSNAHLERIIEHFYENNKIDGAVQVEERELYYIYECVSDAMNNIPECGIDKDSVYKIYDWVRTKYCQYKKETK